MPRPSLLLTSSATLLALTGTVLAQHGPAKVASQEEIPAKRIMPAAPSSQRPAADGLLRIGDPAPKPQLAEILKGDTDFEPFPEGKVTVMEFWATWCGPCKVGMPHISELQARYADDGVTIVGVSAEKPEVVKDFLAKPEWEAKTRYTMALDEDGKTNRSYMKAARRRGIPCAFVVDQDARIAWIGHPMSMDEPLARIVAGDWNLDDARREYEESQLAQQMMSQITASFRQARRTGDYTEAMTLLNQAVEAMPDDAGLQMMKFEALVGPAGDSEGYELGWELFQENRGNAMMLNRMAWYVLDDATVENRDLDFALTVAKAANEASGGGDAAILDTLARAYFEQGRLKSAIKYQKKAVEKADGRMKPELEAILEKYEAEAKKDAA